MDTYLITNNNNDNEVNINKNLNEKVLFKEVKKMNIIKYLNLFFSIFRFTIMFFLISYYDYLPYSINASFFSWFMFAYTLLIFPIFDISNMIIIITGIINRDFSIREGNNLFLLSHICCSCFICSKDIFFLKWVNIYFCFISFIWFFYILYFFIEDFKASIINSIFDNKRILFKLVLHGFDSVLLLCHSYFFHYYQYFLKRGKIYIELYKRLIIKNRNKEAEFVRKELPINLDNFIVNSGTEMQNV